MPGMRVVDAGWLLLDRQESPMHVSSLLVLKQKQPYDVLHHWRERFASFRPCPPFNYICKNDLRHPWGHWETTKNFKFDDHVRGMALTPGENTPDDLHRLAAWLHSLPLDRDRPLWQLFVIEGLPDQHYAVLIKIHHALTDGAFAMALLDHMLSPFPDERCETPFWAQNIRESQPERPVRSFRSFVPAAFGIGQGLLASLQHRPALKWPFQASPSLLNQAITPKRHLEVCTIPLPQVREWAHAHEASLNDTLLFLTSMALHQYLDQHSEKAPESLNALIPVSIRSDADSDHGCHLGFAVADLGNRQASPKQRLDQIKRSTEAAKAFLKNFNATQKQILTSALDILYVGSQLIPQWDRYLPPVANLLVSNVMGPRETLYFNGDTLQEVIPLSVLADGQSLNVTALSYGDQLFISCVCCTDVIEDPRSLRDLLQQSWEDMQRAEFPAAPSAWRPHVGDRRRGIDSSPESTAHR